MADDGFVPHSAQSDDGFTPHEATAQIQSSSPTIHQASLDFVKANPEAAKALDDWAKNPPKGMSMMEMLGSPITSLIHAPGEIVDWAKRGFRNAPWTMPGYAGDNPVMQMYGNALMSLMPSEGALETPLKYADSAKSAVPGQIVRTTVPAEAATAGASSGLSGASDLLGIVSPRAAHAVSLAGRAIDAVKKIGGDSGATTKPFEFTAVDRPAPAWQSAAVPAEAPAPVAPLPEAVLPSGRKVGGVANQAGTPTATPSASTPGQALALKDGQIWEKLSPLDQQLYEHVAKGQANTAAQEVAAKPATVSDMMAAKPTMEEMSAPFKSDEAATTAARDASAAKGEEVHTTNQKAWAQEMANRLYADGKGATPAQAQMFSDADLDAVANNKGHASLSPASKRADATILQMHEALRELWNAGRNPAWPPIGYKPYNANSVSNMMQR